MTGIDLNRAGAPLLEIVSEPDMRSRRRGGRLRARRCTRWCAGSASATATCRKAASAATPTSRCAAQGEAKLGTRCEIKNLNSFRFLQQAIEFEVRRQTELIEDGGTVVQETRLVRPRPRRDALRCAARKTRRTTVTFPIPTCRRSSIDEAWIERIRRRDARAARGGADPAGATSTRLRAEAAMLAFSSREMAQLTSKRLVAAGVDPRLAGNWLARRSVGCAQHGGNSTSRTRRYPQALLAGYAETDRRWHDLRASSPKQVFEAMWAGRRRRRRDHRRPGPAADFRRGRNRENRRRRARSQRGNRRRVQGRQATRRSSRWSARRWRQAGARRIRSRSTPR